jgi:hypothetical protein
MALGFAFGGTAVADTLTYSNVVVRNGSINNQNLAGQTATITIEFADGLTASGGKYTLGAISSATYEFSGAGSFTVDTPQDNLEFGTLGSGAYDLCFYDEGFNPLGMLSGCSAGAGGRSPNDGETIGDFFSRLGGSELSFFSAQDFQMLNAAIGTLDNGASSITEDIVGLAGSSVTIAYNGATGYRLFVGGSCPGQVTVRWSGADPNAQQALVLGSNTGSFRIPNGFPCSGTTLGIAGGVRLVDPPGYFSTGSNGEGQFSGNAGTSACGRYLQLVQGGSCATSNVRQIP